MVAYLCHVFFHKNQGIGWFPLPVAKQISCQSRIFGMLNPWVFFPWYMFDTPNFLSVTRLISILATRKNNKKKTQDFPHSQANSPLKLLSLDLRAGAGAADVNLLVPWSGVDGISSRQFWDGVFFGGLGGGLGFNLELLHLFSCLYHTCILHVCIYLHTELSWFLYAHICV